MIATQGEYRQRIAGQWGFVVFAGIGEVARSPGDLRADDLLWSAGAGLRYQLAKGHPVNLRLDLACGKDGGALYIGVGEAF